jgi:signal transduction histidine kinase
MVALTFREMPETSKDNQAGFLGSRRTLALILATYGVMLAVLLYDLREQLQTEALARIAGATAPLVEETFNKVADEALARDLDYIELGMNELLHDKEEVLEETALRALEIPEIKGAISYEDGGKILASFSASESEVPPAADDFETARNSPLVRFTEPAELSILHHVGEDSESGFIFLQMEGDPLAAERKALDGKLIRQGLFAFTGGGGLILFVFLAFLRRLRRSQEALAERTERLAESNHRLTQACKAAGVGAVTSHLMHALKNPLAGLREYARERREDGEDEETAQLLTEATDRMQTMVEDTLGTLSETEADEATYSFSVAEILELARQRLESTANKANVKLIIEDVAGEVELDNLRANLLVPILLNLGQNAIDASAKGEVKLEGIQEAENLEFRIRDDGKGIPEQFRDRLFRPIQSSKPGGTGVGLAICRELAQRIDAEISLESSSSAGTCFLVRIDTAKKQHHL